MESGLECACVDNHVWTIHCASQREQETPISEHVYCVVVAFKMTEQVKQCIYIKFCEKLEHFLVETIRIIKKAAAMGNW